MATTTVCSRCGERPPMGEAPMPGSIGQSVARSVCNECWAEWKDMSMRVINHYHLQPAVKEHRDKLIELMRDFLKMPAG
jgi:Fe-S cluster biosynthesis and repair protein YggX